VQTPPPRFERSAGRYDAIGDGYAVRRRVEPTWLRAIHSAVGSAARVVNVGAGSGNYEPQAAGVVGVEPSATMLAQRPPGAAPCIRGVAEALPFADERFDVALAIHTVHHWSDANAGLAELRRVARRQVVVTWDPDVNARFWLLRDYVPELADHEATLATVDVVAAALDVRSVDPLPVPRGCRDGFLGAHWEEPSAYLDPRTRAASSGLSLLDESIVTDAMDRLRRDVASGSWAAANSELAGLDALDTGYRLVVAGST
jgi:SAM-dependent methyltransferase